MYYVYSTHRTHDAALIALEDYCAAGVTSEVEYPTIQHRDLHRCITSKIVHKGN